MFILTNSADPDETPRFAASHLGLRCLYIYPFECIQSVPHVHILKSRIATPLDTLDVPDRDMISQNMKNEVNLLDYIDNSWMKKERSLASR